MGNPTALEDDVTHRLRILGFKGPRFADEAPVHEVCVDPFWIGRTEVTATQWQRVMGSLPPAGTGQQPATGMSWHQAMVFTSRLTKLSDGDSHFRLPTEAEWEYACRGGVAEEAPFEGAEARVSQAWYSVGDHRITEPAEVGQLEVNPWGLQDMLGNVWEWTQDSYSPEGYLRHALRNPVVSNQNGQRVIRGASHRSFFLEVRCSGRSAYPIDQGLGHIGLRLVRSLRQ